MDTTVTLYDYKSNDIRIHVVARFEKDDLVIDGYDIGKRVEEVWGDSDYEYTITIKGDAVLALSKALHVDNDHFLILQALAKNFQGNHCFSALADFLSHHQIKHERFSWT
jgi:hypothetical protein